MATRNGGYIKLQIVPKNFKIEEKILSDTPIKWKYCVLLLNALFYEKCGRTAFKCVTISGFSTSVENFHGQDKKKIKKALNQSCSPLACSFGVCSGFQAQTAPYLTTR